MRDSQKADVAAAFQAAAVDVLITKLDRALHHLCEQDARPRSIVIGGGVSANSHLRQRVAAFGASHDLIVRIPEMVYCLDNAAMIAGLAHHRLVDHRVDDLQLGAIATAAG